MDPAGGLSSASGHDGVVGGSGWVHDSRRGVERWLAGRGGSLERLGGGVGTVDGSSDGRAGGVVGSRCGGRRRGRGLLLVLWVGDAELSGVLVLALVGARVNDELDTVAGGIGGGLEAGGWSPNVATVVLGALDDDALQLQVGGWSLEEEKSDGAVSGGLPGDGEALAGWDEGVQARLRDGVAL